MIEGVLPADFFLAFLSLMTWRKIVRLPPLFLRRGWEEEA